MPDPVRSQPRALSLLPLSRRQFLLGGTAMLSVGRIELCWALADDDLAAARAELYRGYAQRLAELADWCERQQLSAQASLVRTWLPDRLPNRQYLFVPAEVRDPPQAEVAQSSGKDTAPLGEFEKRFAALRGQQALALFALAERAANQRRASLACQLASESAREDLACQRAWRFLGFRQFAGGWHTPFEIQQLKAGNVWHERFGWLPKAHVARYERGQRFFHGRWMSEREEADQRDSVQNGWRIESDHYRVTSDCGLEETVALARQLERLRAVWQQVFTAYFIDDGALAARLSAGEPLIAPPAVRQNVVFYRTRGEYNDALRAAQPQIESTLGIYFADKRMACFFAGLDQEQGTLYHEATHQLFAETRPIAKDLEERPNFWIVEGAACFMESLVESDGYWTLGGPDAGRMPAARHRRLRDGFYVPLAELSRLTMKGLQGRDDMARLYTQSAGLTTFLIQRFSEATTDYLRAVYSGSADSDTLARLTGNSDDELDRLYGEYLRALES